MPETIRTRTLLATGVALALMAGPALAHGWVFTPPPAPDYVADGGGDPNYQGAVGGGDGATEPAPQDGPVAGPEPEPATPGPRGVTPTPPRNAGTSPTVVGRSASPSRPKGMATPWRERVHVDWKPVFPPAKDGYDPNADVDVALRQLPAGGNWARQQGPSMLLVWDPSKESHRQAVERLDADDRVVAAARLFNCFKMDGRAMSRAPKEVTLCVYDAEGRLAGEVRGSNRLHRVFRVMRDVWEADSKTELTPLVPRIAALLEGMAWCDHQMDWMASRIVCPDCGHERADVVEAMAQMKVRRDGLVRALEKLQSD